MIGLGITLTDGSTFRDHHERRVRLIRAKVSRREVDLDDSRACFCLFESLYDGAYKWHHWYTVGEIDQIRTAGRR